jgi:hypothetical protein
MGGTDEASNIKEITIKEHAEEHYKLWKHYGYWQDEVAWRALSGQISCEEATKEATSRARKGIALSQEWKDKISSSLSGKKHSAIHVEKQRLSHKGHKRTLETRKKISIARAGKLLSEEHKNNIRLSVNLKDCKEKQSSAKRKIITCPHCNKSGCGPMYRWHFDNCKEKRNVS